MREKSNLSSIHCHNNNGRGDEEEVMTLCPKCQDDLSLTIEDTFLVRKISKMESTTANIPDSELSAAELRFKHSMTAKKNEEAKNRLMQFQRDIESGNISPRTSVARRKNRRRKRNNVNKNVATTTGNFSSTSADLGTNIMMNPQKDLSSLLSLQFMKYNNIDLFQGMQDILSHDEQTFISDQITSGDVNKVVQATQILHELKRIHHKDDIQSSKMKNSSFSEAEKRALRMSMPIEERTKLEELEKYLEINPLPRMPKYVILQADFDVYAKRGKILKFRDDNWDGSVSDAFARVHTTMNPSMAEELYHQPFQSSSFESDYHFQNNEEGGFVNGITGEATHSENRENRVLIYAARKQAAKWCEIGDIVTHFDGNEFRGDANELRKVINGLYLSENQSFSMVLNAEQGTADALKDLLIELQKIQST